jgi:hypothetical protein
MCNSAHQNCSVKAQKYAFKNSSFSKHASTYIENFDFKMSHLSQTQEQNEKVMSLDVFVVAHALGHDLGHGAG